MTTSFPMRDSSNEPTHCDKQVDEIVHRMRQRWLNGDHVLAEDVISVNAFLLHAPQLAIQIIYEEVCLREEMGESIHEADVVARFPQWRDELHVLLQCHELVQPTLAKVSWPAPGESIGPLQILQELGQGALGRVYLATENQLGCRSLVVKVAPRDMREPQMLSRLQHTNIAPIYFVHDDVERQLTAFCMPYVGGTTLDQLFASMSSIPISQRSGKDLIDALDRFQRLPTDSTMGVGPVRALLSHRTYTQSIVWIAACVADALHHVHNRGLVHLDVKPSNVLLAADGQPMLLDFHLASEPIAAGSIVRERLGGTWQYMSNEHKAAMKASREGQAIAEAVDARSDCFGLGALLYEGLSGSKPTMGWRIAELRSKNPEVSDGLADVLAKCLADKATDRYDNLEALAIDLRSHLSNLPLRGVHNRSVVERWTKWRRRQPQAVPIAALGCALLFAILGSLSFWWSNVQHNIRRAEQAIGQLPTSTTQETNELRLSNLREALRGLEGVPGQAQLKRRVHQALEQSEAREAIERLQKLADQIRFRDGLDANSLSLSQPVMEMVHELWSSRQQVFESAKLVSDERGVESVRSDLSELAVLLAKWNAGDRSKPAKPQIAAEILRDAESLLGQSLIVALTKSWLQQNSLGGRSDSTAIHPDLPRANTPWEHTMMGREWMQQGRFEEAQREFATAIQMQPQLFWPRYYSAVSSFRSGQFQQAVHSLDVCIALSPSRAECYFNRALCLGKLNRLVEAISDDTQAMRLSSELHQAAIHRAALHSKLGRFDQAIQDLEYAKEHGADENKVDYQLAQTYVERKDLQNARSVLTRLVRREPSNTDVANMLRSLEPTR
jgi:eukaryotic-like serine/threonine-protein kinase